MEPTDIDDDTEIYISQPKGFEQEPSLSELMFPSWSLFACPGLAHLKTWAAHTLVCQICRRQQPEKSPHVIILPRKVATRHHFTASLRLFFDKKNAAIVQQFWTMLDIQLPNHGFDA